jgi:hypothetical protein
MRAERWLILQAELLGMPGRPLFCPHRSAAFSVTKNSNIENRGPARKWVDSHGWPGDPMDKRLRSQLGFNSQSVIRGIARVEKERASMGLIIPDAMTR